MRLISFFIFLLFFKFSHSQNDFYGSYENNFIYYEDEYGRIKVPKPNLLGNFQIDNCAAAIATIRNLQLGVKDENIKEGVTKIKSVARLQEITSGKLKNICKNNRLYLDGSHNPLGAKALNEYLNTLNCNKHLILGMMSNKNHEEYISYFNDISSITTIDVPNQPNAIKGDELKKKLNKYPNVNYKKSIEEALNSLNTDKDDLIMMTGSLYLAGELLNRN